jgi:hypothetical protein
LPKLALLEENEQDGRIHEPQEAYHPKPAN